MKIDIEHNFGDTVYLKTDIDQRPRIVTAIIVRPGCVLYEVNCAIEYSSHHNFEISVDPDIVLKTNN